MPDSDKPSEMVRVPTKLIPAVRELSRLHRQGKTDEVLALLNELITTLDNGTRPNYGTNQTILEMEERLNNLESQFNDGGNSSSPASSQRLDNLEQKIDSINTRLSNFAEAIMQLQSNINNQPKRNKSYNNSYYQGQAVKIQPINEESLASRLGVSVETIRRERDNQPAPLFAAWCKRKDTSGIGWEFNEKTGLYHPNN
ncbi:MAG: hypothetical protein IGS39_22890 [Calothrix sp. C42_A2020_038]|nr:hypothetical protein [Calothrix sp. C42_A2020_038]